MNRARFRFVVPLTLMWTGIVTAVAFAGEWTTEPSFGCRLWNPHPQGGETIVWNGACANGLAQGHGAAQWSRNNLPSESDEGEWREGRQVGYGTQAWPTGHYEGELYDSEPHGHGLLTLRNAHYEGEFRNGKPNGLGTLTNGTEVIYGTWTDGCYRNGTRRVSFGVPLSAC